MQANVRNSPCIITHHKQGLHMTTHAGRPLLCQEQLHYRTHRAFTHPHILALDLACLYESLFVSVPA